MEHCQKEARGKRSGSQEAGGHFPIGPPPAGYITTCHLSQPLCEHGTNSPGPQYPGSINTFLKGKQEHIPATELAFNVSVNFVRQGYFEFLLESLTENLQHTVF